MNVKHDHKITKNIKEWLIKIKGPECAVYSDNYTIIKFWDMKTFYGDETMKSWYAPKIPDLIEIANFANHALQKENLCNH